MLTPIRMKHVLIQALTDDLPKVSLTLAEIGVFDPDDRSVEAEKFPIIPGERYRTVFNQANSRLDKIVRLLDLEPLPAVTSVRVIEESELERLNSWLGDVWATGSSYEEQFRRLLEQERLIVQREDSLGNFASLNVDLGLLQGDRKFLNLFIGTVPREHLQQLEEALSLAGHIVYQFQITLESVGVIIVGPKSAQPDELQSVLRAADFRAIPVPPDLHSQPENIRSEIKERREELVQERKNVETHLRQWADSMRQDLSDARRAMVMAEPFVRLGSSMRSIGSLGAVTGWVPAEDMDKLDQTLTQRLSGHPFLLTTRNPKDDERPLVPTVMRPSFLLAPFQDLVRQYGVPRYGELNPTPLFAITFVLMFGAMFGDVGQGAVIALAGWFARSKLKHFERFVLYLGVSSITFGFMYGSVFGYESVVEPIWIAPTTDPMYMLTVAFIWGVGFILVASALSIYNHIAVGERMEAFFGNHGIVSLILYTSGLWGLSNMAQGGTFGTPASVLALGALSIMFAYVWHETHAPLGERILVSLIETMELLIGYLSNTLSFLRVAAFSLNHAALAFAVFAIAEMMQSTTSHWITIVLGNVFVLILEGGIVVIQTMRLEYYEGFSRYYFGDGHEFQPIKIDVKAAK